VGWRLSFSCFGPFNEPARTSCLWRWPGDTLGQRQLHSAVRESTATRRIRKRQRLALPHASRRLAKWRNRQRWSRCRQQSFVTETQSARDHPAERMRQLSASKVGQITNEDCNRPEFRDFLRYARFLHREHNCLAVALDDLSLA
jgi:hypothetical protein